MIYLEVSRQDVFFYVSIFFNGFPQSICLYSHDATAHYVKTHQMFYGHITPEKFENVVQLLAFFQFASSGIQQILQSDWFLERRESSHPDHYSGRIRVAHKPTTTLRQLLTNVKDRDEANNRQGAVYKIKCSDCQASYIGETGRSLS